MAANEQQRKVSERLPRQFSSPPAETARRAARDPAGRNVLARRVAFVSKVTARSPSLLSPPSSSSSSLSSRDIDGRATTADEDGNDVAVTRHVDGEAARRVPGITRGADKVPPLPPGPVPPRAAPHSRIIARLHSKIAQSVGVFTSASRAAVKCATCGATAYSKMRDEDHDDDDVSGRVGFPDGSKRSPSPPLRPLPRPPETVALRSCFFSSARSKRGTSPRGASAGALLTVQSNRIEAQRSHNRAFVRNA